MANKLTDRELNAKLLENFILYSPFINLYLKINI